MQIIISYGIRSYGKGDRNKLVFCYSPRIPFYVGCIWRSSSAIFR